MYLSHFRLEREPFSLTPDPRFLFLSDRHREALAHLLYGLGERGGFVQLTGEVGTGKTTLCRSLLEQVPEGVDVALILNPRLTALELVSSVCDELGVPWPAGTQSLKQLVDVLNRHLLDAHARGRRTVLVIDEAQQLSADVLEQVRLLTNLETATAKLLQIVLIGQPELQTLMARPELRQLSQRVTARYHLAPLSREETCAYVRHRLEVAGGAEPLFTAGAMRKVHRLSGGIPRLINVICDRALLGAYARDGRRVGARLVSLAGAEVMGRRQPSFYSRGPAWAAAGLAVAVVAGGWWAAREYRPPRIPFRTVSASASAPLSANSQAQQALAPVGAVAGAEFEVLLADPSLRCGPEDADETLLRLWRLGPPPPGRREPACGLATAAGLECVRADGGWARLERYNRPARLEFLTPSGTRFGVVVALGERDITLAFGELRVTRSRASVSRVWGGAFVLLRKPPPAGVAGRRVGDSGAPVGWIRERLDWFEGVPSGPREGGGEEVFDPPLRNRLTAFQRLHGLVATGRVGPQTLIALAALAEGPSVPMLRPLPAGKNG